MSTNITTNAPAAEPTSAPKESGYITPEFPKNTHKSPTLRTYHDKDGRPTRMENELGEIIKEGEEGDLELVAEAAPEPEVEPAKPEDSHSTRIKHLMKKETELQRLREEIKKERESISAEKEKYTKFNTEVETFKELLQRDKFGALKSLGLSETDFINIMSEITTEKSPQEIARTEAQHEVRKLERQLQEERDAVQRQQQEANTQRVKQGIKETIAKNAETYEYVHYMGDEAVDTVIDYIRQVYEQGGGKEEPISIEDALRDIESHYEERDAKMNSLKKRAAKFSSAPAPAQKAPQTIEEKILAQPKAPSPTLTNKVTQTSKPKRLMSEEEKLEALYARLEPMGKE